MNILRTVFSEDSKTPERQRWLRIRISMAAYAYEYRDESIMSDHDYDKMSLLIDPSINTGNGKMDAFFKKSFTPESGMWIRGHPELDKLAQRYDTHREMLLKMNGKKK